MKTTTIGSYPKPSYLKISDWFQGKDNSPEDCEKTWILAKKTLSSKIKDYNKSS